MDTDQLASYFKALSEPVRLRILNLLMQKGELCVCDIVEALMLPQSLISRHLAYLKKHRLVTSRRQGNWQYYEFSLLESTRAPQFSVESLKQAFEQCSDCEVDLKRLNLSTDGCSTNLTSTSTSSILSQGDL